jgi:anti-sigma factor RsiW
MSLSQEQMFDVMAYADGELDRDGEARVRALVEQSAEAKELYASLQALGDGVRAVVDEPAVDVADVVMQRIQPNDLDKARIRRTNRVRMGVVAASLVAIAAGVAFYVRQNGEAQATNQPAPTHSILPIVAGSESNALASLHPTGVEVDSVDTPSSVSVFYVPADGTEPSAKNGESTLVVWVDDKVTP